MIRYQKWRDGELEDIEIHEEQAFEDLLRFWTHWLSGIEDAASGSLDSAALEPIRDLTRLLDDLRTGASSALRKGFVKAGKNSDPWPVAHYKLAVGLCYKLLMDIALRDKDYAEKIITQCCKKLGLRPVSGISDQARKLSKYRKKNPETLPPPVIFAAKNSGLTTFLAIFISRLEECTIYDID